MKLEFSHPLWGLGEDDGIPAKPVLFKGTWESTMAMEDFLQHNRVFVNGITGQTCHSDSYMTCVDYQALDKALGVLEEHYKPTVEDWKAHLRYWLTNQNMQPPLKLVALCLCRKLGVPSALFKESP